jgi:ribonuclease HII
MRSLGPTLEFEQPLWQAGYIRIAGVDEAGRGAWAGPVSAGAVILPPDPWIVERLSGVRDSKQMTPLQRTYWAEVIRHEALAWGVGFASHDEIDLVGLLPATRLAMKRALRDMLFPQNTC